MSTPNRLRDTWSTESSWSLYTLISEYPKYILDPEYQRDPVWSHTSQKILIDSILRYWDIGLFILNGILVNEGGSFFPKYEVIDGQQRIRAIHKFVNGKLSLSEAFDNYTIRGVEYDLRGKKWTDNDFPQEIKNHFYGYTVKMQVYIEKSESEVARIFARVQEGKPLNSSEKINAILGYIRNEIKQLSHHELMKKTRLRQIRFNRLWVASQCVYREITNFNNGNYLNSNLVTITKMFEDNKRNNRENERLITKTNRVFNYLNQVLDTRADLINKNADFITIYQVVSYLLDKNYIIDRNNIDWPNFIGPFINKVEEARKMMKTTRNVTEALHPYWNYYEFRRRENGDSNKNRFEFMIIKLLEEYPSLEKRDHQRYFDEYQKRVVAMRANYQCQDPQSDRCIGETGLNIGHVHHIVRWIDGGSTTIENGQWLCPNCHGVKGSN